MDEYLNQTQFVAEVSAKGDIIGPVEKWDAHRKGILHLGFTVSIFYKGQILLQHRKHPVFNDVFDASVSSHQLFIEGSLQEDIEAVEGALLREWNIDRDALISKPEFVGMIQYQARDSKSEYVENEHCKIFKCEINKLIVPNMEFSYGFSLKEIKDLKNPFDPLYPLLAPWVHEAISKNLI